MAGGGLLAAMGVIRPRRGRRARPMPSPADDRRPADLRGTMTAVGASKGWQLRGQGVMNASRTSAGLLAALLLAGCTAPAGHEPVTGNVAGRLLREGGPAGQGSQPGLRPMSGPVTFTSAHRRVTVRVGNSGIFSVRLPPGRYRVSGPCSRPSPVTVTARHTVHVKIICIVPRGSPPSA